MLAHRNTHTRTGAATRRPLGGALLPSISAAIFAVAGCSESAGSSSNPPSSPPPPAANTAPAFTSASDATAVEKKIWTGYFAEADDAESDTLTYSVSGGADEALFTIDSSTGALAFAFEFDVATPGDANGDNVFEAELSVSDGQLNDTIDVAVTLEAEVLVDYLEEFDTAGEPSGPPGAGLTWRFLDDIRPVSGWNDIVPGDGFAHITLDADPSNDTDPSNPFQDIRVRDVGAGHRLEMYVKDLAVPGAAGYIFTYQEADGIFDEIDIEIVADDEDTPPPGHDTLPPDGWTDGRFNTWGDAVAAPPFQPETSHKQAVIDIDGQPVSLIDDAFHVYTIEWRHIGGPDGRDGVAEFYIDGVHQTTIERPIGDNPAEVNLGYRQLRWAGDYELGPGETHTALIDWLRIAPIDEDSPSANADRHTVGANTTLVVAAPGILDNDEGLGLTAILINGPSNGALTLNADGGFTYQPNPGFTGTDMFVYRANDGSEKGESNAAVVWVTVG